MDSLADILTCDICALRYDDKTRLPKVLPCGHTFCLSCLRQLQQISIVVFNCPTCRQLVISLDKAPTNYALCAMKDAVAGVAIKSSSQDKKTASTQTSADQIPTVKRTSTKKKILGASKGSEPDFHDLLGDFTDYIIFSSFYYLEVCFHTQNFWQEIDQLEIDVGEQRTAYYNAKTRTEKLIAEENLYKIVQGYTSQAVREFARHHENEATFLRIKAFEMEIIREGDWWQWMRLQRMKQLALPQNVNTVRRFTNGCKTFLGQSKLKSRFDGLTSSKKFVDYVEEAKAFAREMISELPEADADQTLQLEIDKAFNELLSLEERV